MVLRAELSELHYHGCRIGPPLLHFATTFAFLCWDAFQAVGPHPQMGFTLSKGSYFGWVVARHLRGYIVWHPCRLSQQSCAGAAIVPSVTYGLPTGPLRREELPLDSVFGGAASSS